MVSGTKNRYQSGDPVTALIVSLLPNLSTLELPMDLLLGFYIGLIICKASQLQLSGKPGRYCNLRHIEVSSFNSRSPVFDFIAPFIQLPSVRSLTLGETLMIEEDFDGIGVPAPNITHLSFIRADIHPHTISPLLKYFPSLTHFSYIYQSRAYNPRPFCPLFFREGIQHLQHSLEELILVNGEKDPEEEWQLNWNEETHEDLVIGSGVIVPRPSNFGSLNGFQSLRRLEATVFTLMGPVPRAIFGKGRAAVLVKRLHQMQQFVESLPMSLEELVLWNCRHEVGGIMSPLLDGTRQGEMMKLKMMELGFIGEFYVQEVSW